jgi:UDPglucose 6-dehydrogenase
LKIGFVGLGKLGLPVALALEKHGHAIVGTDLSFKVKQIFETRTYPYKEKGVTELLKKSELKLTDDLDEVIRESDFVFCAIQTPHDPRYEGLTKLPPDDRKDFNYNLLKIGVQQIAQSCEKLQKKIILLVVSTVLPGTIDREIVPVLNDYISLCYNPFFIAMGTVIYDFENPEFVLLGCADNDVIEAVKSLYNTVHCRKVLVTTIKTAELVKVAYNTYISSKLCFINTMAEICEKIGGDVDDLTTAMSLSTDRLISTKYLQAGMGDGGGCHPRDLIAMSWLAKKLDLSYNLFESYNMQREKYTVWLATVIGNAQKAIGLPIVILGKAYKAETNITVGSSALLLSNILAEQGLDHYLYDPHVDDFNFGLEEPCVYFIATQHQCFAEWAYPKGSVIIDPWGYIPNKENVSIMRIGRGTCLEKEC